MIFSFVYTVFALFTFHILIVYCGTRGWLFKNLLFESVLICSAETSGLVKRITALSCKCNHISICDISESIFRGSWTLFRPPKQYTIKVQTMKAKNYITKFLLQYILCSLNVLGNWLMHVQHQVKRSFCACFLENC